MIKIPATIKIGGHTWNIILDKGLSSEGRRAMVDYKRLKIIIHPDKKASVVAEGFIHELLHVINEIYLNRQIESEDIIEPLAEGLWQVLEQLGISFNFEMLPDETRE